MNYKDQLNDLRKSIDEIDAQLVPLFVERMKIAKKIAEVKEKNELRIRDVDREQKVVENAIMHIDDDLKSETALFMRSIMSLSRSYQRRNISLEKKQFKISDSE